uniref:DUF3426 domain-containing protein n=1 Tax=Candidatus Kentrum sp. DK TaxID=2126562 RepID=A0A450TDL9_9GAMM|nr:MAG: Protein of unknown function (DUF3426) [Candidatus Kentron sp. DK]
MNSPFLTPRSNNHESGSPAREETLPWILRQEMASPEAGGNEHMASQLMFAVGVFFFFLLLLGQYTWFHSFEISQRFPDTRPWVEAFCRGTGCEIPMQRDPARIRITDREVRIHPDYESALLISVRFVNMLPQAQPFPLMQFALFNVNGEMIAARVFRPEEYLDEETNITVGMGAGKPVQAVLGLLAQEEAAVSFEFTFL